MKFKTLTPYSFLIALFLSTSCSQLVHVQKTRPVKKIQLDKINVYDELVRIPTGIGPVYYEITSPSDIVTKGKLERTELNSSVMWASIGASAITIPLLASFGLFLINPLWKFTPLISLRGGGSGATLAFMSQTMSPFTIPVTAIFAMLGSTPLLGLLASEKLPDITHHLP